MKNIEEIITKLPDNVEFKEAAYLAHMHVKTLSKWCTQGKVKRDGCKNNFTIPKQDVVNLIQANIFSIEGWLTPNYVSKTFNVKQKTVHSWCEKGIVKAQKDIFGRWMISPTEVDKIKRASVDHNLKDIILVGVTKYYSLIKTSKDLTINQGITENDENYYKQFQRNYKTLSRMVVTVENKLTYKLFGENLKRIYVDENTYLVLIDIIRVKEILEITGICQKSLYHWAKKNLTHCKIPNCEGFFLRSEFINFWNNHRLSTKL